MSNKNEYMNTYMKNRYRIRRQNAIDFLGGQCGICGTNNNLQFHHKDESTKLFTIARGSSRSDEIFWAEVKKCILLCSTCHRERHKSTYPCGTEQKYWRGCKCVDCLRAYNIYSQQYKQRRKGAHR